MVFKKQKIEPAQPYNPDVFTIRNIRSGIEQLDSLLKQNRISDEQYQNELKLFANSIERLEEKYGCSVRL